jgi:ethanolamine utilization protein EutQ (cupin superfamily)
MVKLIKSPTIIKAQGNKEKIIKEFFGLVNSGTADTSIAMMESPEGWEEPGQKPEFDEYTLILEGKLQVKTDEANYIVEKGQAILIHKNTWVQYSSPFEGGAKYVAVCLPAFSPDTVNRDL